MHIRYRYVTYRYTDGSQQQLERHYRQLVHDALRQSHQSILQRSATWRPLADIRESAEDAMLLNVVVSTGGFVEKHHAPVDGNDAPVVAVIHLYSDRSHTDSVYAWFVTSIRPK